MSPPAAAAVVAGAGDDYGLFPRSWVSPLDACLGSDSRPFPSSDSSSSFVANSSAMDVGPSPGFCSEEYCFQTFPQFSPVSDDEPSSLPPDPSRVCTEVPSTLNRAVETSLFSDERGYYEARLADSDYDIPFSTGVKMGNFAGGANSLSEDQRVCVDSCPETAAQRDVDAVQMGTLSSLESFDGKTSEVLTPSCMHSQDARIQTLTTKNTAQSWVFLSLKERLTQALQHIKCMHENLLAQIWIPVIHNGHFLLTTYEQPFVVEQGNVSLIQYRSISAGYVFPAERDSQPRLGLPGRVYTNRKPEWTPNVQFYSKYEYLRVGDAAYCNVRGFLAVPVFLPNSENCVAVIELVTNAEQIQYVSQIDIICQALKWKVTTPVLSSRHRSTPRVQMP